MWPERSEGVEAFGEVPLGHGAGEERVALEFAGGDVVAGEVAADVVIRVLLGNVFCVAGDDEAEFAFVVCLVVLCDFWNDDICVVVV